MGGLGKRIPDMATIERAKVALATAIVESVEIIPIFSAALIS